MGWPEQTGVIFVDRMRTETRSDGFRVRLGARGRGKEGVAARCQLVGVGMDELTAMKDLERQAREFLAGLRDWRR